MNFYFNELRLRELKHIENAKFLIPFFIKYGFSPTFSNTWYIAKGELEELLACCKIVCGNPSEAKNILPTSDDVYDDLYFVQVADMINFIESTLPQFDRLSIDEYITLELHD